MNPVCFNSKSARRRGKRERFVHPDSLSGRLFSIYFHYFSESCSEIFYLFPPRPACCSYHIFERMHTNFSIFSPCLQINFPSLSVPIYSQFCLHVFFFSALNYPHFLTVSFSSQAPCENLRTPSTYPGNMLPHHPAQGNFEDFTCWAEPCKAAKCALCNQSQPLRQQELSDAQRVRDWCEI